MDPFRVIPALDLAKEDEISCILVSASAVFVGTQRGAILRCSVPKPSEEDTQVIMYSQGSTSGISVVSVLTAATRPPCTSGG